MLLIRSWSPRDVGGLASEADRFGTNTIRGEYDTERYDTERYDTERYDTERYDSERYVTERYVTGRIRHSEGAPATEESRAWVRRSRYCHGVNALSAD